MRRPVQMKVRISAAMRAQLAAECRRLGHSLSAEVARRIESSFTAEAEARWRERELRIDWSDYDTAQAQVTRAERELFEASPAYRRYQQMREDRERRGTGDWRLKRGDWRTP